MSGPEGRSRLFGPLATGNLLVGSPQWMLVSVGAFSHEQQTFPDFHRNAGLLRHVRGVAEGL